MEEILNIDMYIYETVEFIKRKLFTFLRIKI